ncbi:MAG: hypothetical protein ABI288_02665, partial [Ginsengibacter sp.]
AQKFIEGMDYTIMERVRVLDKIAFTEPVEAYSILVPKGWKNSSDIWWTTPGNVGGGVNTKFKTASPDGQYSLEFFPMKVFLFGSDPQINEIMRNNQNEYTGFGEPLDAAQYFKQVFVNQELGGPAITDIKNNDEGLSSLKERADADRLEMMRYGASDVNMYPSAITARVKWKDGSEGIVLCGIMISETIIPNIYNGSYSKSYVTSTTKRIVFKYPANESEKASRMMSTMLSSVRTNMARINAINNAARQARENSNIIHQQKIRMIDQQTNEIGKAAIARGNQNLADMDTRMRSWEKSQGSQDRINTNFVKAIREVENYRDETGKVELSSGYSHAWSRSDGSSYIMSDNPNFDPSSVLQDQRWKELKRVDQ